MKKLFVSALAMLAVALGFTACSSEDELVKETPAQGQKVTVIATTEEPAQRTMLGEQGTDGTYPVFWSADDKITIGGKVFELTEGATTSTGTFELKTDEEKPEAGTDVIAFYPASYDGTNWTTSQTYVEDNIPQGVPMKATGIIVEYGERPMISPIWFKNEGGILRLNLKGTAKVASITVSATGLDAITLNCGEGVELNSETATPFHIAVPGTAYSGLKIEITDDAGAVCTKTAKSAITVQRSMITDINLTAGSFVVPTTGTAEATIGGVKTNVKWVQLWAGGPKFAEYNVGATSATEAGTDMLFSDAAKTGAEYEWGANWCTPSKDQMDELLKAATTSGSEKVKCEYTQENTVWGFKFTGLTDGYTSNSVFFPAQGGDSSDGGADYWSGTADGDRAWDVSLHYYDGDWNSYWESDFKFNYFLVRPVLKETPASNQINGHDYVVLAGYKWATENVGAVTFITPKGTHATYGYYYTQAYAEAAAMSWGGTWELPTQEQWEALMDGKNCTWTWTNQDGKAGYKVSDNNDASKFIFLPAAGIYDDDYKKYYDQGDYGYYWSADHAGYHYFHYGNRGMSYDSNLNNGMAVRPVSR